MEVNEREEKPHESRSEEAIDTPSKKTTSLPPIEYVDYEGEEQLPGASSSSASTSSIRDCLTLPLSRHFYTNIVLTLSQALILVCLCAFSTSMLTCDLSHHVDGGQGPERALLGVHLPLLPAQLAAGTVCQQFRREEEPLFCHTFRVWMKRSYTTTTTTHLLCPKSRPHTPSLP